MRIKSNKFITLQYPEPLIAAYPQAGQPLYLHIIHLKPNWSEPINDNRHKVFHKILASRTTFGILSVKRMPSMPSFPIFMNVGDLTVSLEINIALPPMSQQEIDSLKLFHFLVFHKVLNIIRDFMLFDTENGENSFLVVPGKYKITLN